MAEAAPPAPPPNDSPAPVARPLEDHQVRRTMRLSIYEGSVAMFFINWTAGSVLTGYAIYLGATPAELGLIASVPLLGQVLAPIIAWLAGRTGRRKILAVASAVIGRGLWLLAALLPAIAPEETRVEWLIATIAFSSIFIAGNGALWTSWMGDVVPPRERGRYFGFRSGFHGIIGTAANLSAGVWLDRVASPADFQALLIAAVGLGMIAAVLLALHAEPPPAAARLRFRQTLTVPVLDRSFRRFLTFAVYWQFAVLVSSPFVIPYFLKYLNMNFTEIAIWSTISSVLALFTSPLWGRVADRTGNKPVIAVTTVGAGTLLPLTWILATPGHLWPIWISAMIDAIVWSAINPAVFNLALGTAPQANRAAYIAVLSAATGAAGFIGGALSGPLKATYEHLTFNVGGFEWTAFHWLFLTSALLRVQAWRLLRRVPEDGAWKTREFLAWRPDAFRRRP